MIELLFASPNPWGTLFFLAFWVMVGLVAWYGKRPWSDRHYWSLVVVTVALALVVGGVATNIRYASERGSLVEMVRTEVK